MSQLISRILIWGENMTIYLGENIKRLRQEKGITQETLADFLGVTFQSVSRWERGESYPDITTLPEIAAYFKISVDELLGANRAENEEEIKRLLEEHDNLHWNEKALWDSINNLKERYPNDFRVQLRYMRMLNSVRQDAFAANGPKILSIYKNIEQNCTDDTIRIKAKNQYISYLLRMACDKDSGITFEDAEKVINELPKLEDCQEMYCFNYEYVHKTPDKVYETIETLIYMQFDFLSGWFLQRRKFSIDYQIDILEKSMAFFDYIFDDGNYGRLWTKVISSCGILGMFYYEKGDSENSLRSLRKTAELAIKFDNLETITTLHSTLFEGRIYDKNIHGSDYAAKRQMKEFMMQHYGFSDEFKSTPEFRNIISMLE